MTIRPARPGDAAALAVLAERTFRDAFTAGNDPADMALHCAKSFGREIQRAEIERAGLVTLVAETDGELIGFAQVRLEAPKDCVSADRPAELWRLYVARRWHGRGVSQALMDAVFDAAARSGCDRLWLGVWKPNARAVAFYRKLGFEVVGEHEYLFGRDRQRDLVMAVAVPERPGA